MLGKNLSNSSGAIQTTYVDDVFSAYTYTGNGSTQTITNGIDLAGRGGMVWVKERTTAQNHNLWDSERGLGAYLKSNTTDTTSALSGMSFTPTGMSITGAGSVWNASGLSYVSWTFAKAPKFFDVVTWVGSGVDGQTISHSLGGTPGGIIIKRTDTSSGWATDFRHTSGRYHGLLNTTDACNNGSSPAAVTMTNGYTAYVDGTSFALYAGSTGRANVNASGGTYVAYLFAHDTATDGIVQCGSFTTDGSGNASVSLGWEPQYFLTKRIDNISNWNVLDTARAFDQTATVQLYANATNADVSITNTAVPTATGVSLRNSWGAASGTYIYLAIRRPNKPPTVGTQVYNAISRTGTQAVATVTGVGFAPDLAIGHRNTTANFFRPVSDRLRGSNRQSYTNSTDAENSSLNELNSFDMDGVTLGTAASLGWWNTSGGTYINHFFKRAPGVFDVVCYTGNATTNTVSHSLGVVPELAIFKGRTVGGDWFVNIQVLSTIYATVFLNLTNATSNNSLYSGAPTASSFTLNTTNVNNNTQTYVAYLFATKAGISKVFSYTGNGSSQTINCGFTTGARFVMIKRTNSTGDWFVWDTVRGIIAGNDPHTSFNSTAADVTTDDSIDPDTSGFIVNQLAATNINVTSATYIGLAFA